MINRSLWKRLLPVALAGALAFAVTACGNQGRKAEEADAPEAEVTEEAETKTEEAATPETEEAETETPAEESAELTEAQIEALMDQVAEKVGGYYYKDVLPDAEVAVAKILGTESDGDQFKAYALLNVGEYVTLKEKAYNMSGSFGACILHYEFKDGEPSLMEVEWSADGSDHDQWMKDHFPQECLDALSDSALLDADGNSILLGALDEKASKALGVAIESENQLHVDVDAGTYEIVKITESGEGEEYSFDTETIDAGKLEDL